MFNSIRGIISEKTAEKLEGTVFLLSGGLEWDIAVPATDLNRLPALGEEGRVFTWLYHKEDQVRLYGFIDEQRRNTFLELLKVEGIGPKGAIKILGGIGQKELEEALENDDLARLEAVPGLGKKTAQKMILALKGKLVNTKAAGENPYGDLVEALAGMGYERRLAAEALAKAELQIPSGITGAEKEALLFKQAIVYLSSSL